jgi:DNA-binding MarR family transcriptional regulator
VYLTDKGRALFNSLNIVVRRREQRLLEGFSPSGIDSAFNLIRRLSRNMRSRS